MLTTDLDVDGCITLILWFDLVVLGHRLLLFIVRHFQTFPFPFWIAVKRPKSVGWVVKKITREKTGACLKWQKLCSFTNDSFEEVGGG
jgi:hypothetical protein